MNTAAGGGGLLIEHSWASARTGEVKLQQRSTGPRRCRFITRPIVPSDSGTSIALKLPPEVFDKVSDPVPSTTKPELLVAVPASPVETQPPLNVVLPFTVM